MVRSARKKTTTFKERMEKQQLLDKAYKLARIGTWEYDMRTETLHWSEVTKEVHGFGPDYKPDVESTINLFKEGYHRETFRQAARDAIEKEKPFDVELKIISGRGDERWIRATGEPEYENGKCVRFYGISQDVTGRRRAEEKLLLNEKRFKALVQNGADMIAILDKEANYKYVSPSSYSVLGIAPADFIGKNAFEFIHNDDKEALTGVLSQGSEKQQIEIEPYRFCDSKGNWRWIETTLTNMLNDPAVEGWVANSRDVTERKKRQKQLADSLKEKETLLAEIHHRVKNNLAVVTGLLGLQAMNEEKQEVKDRLNDCITRLQTMNKIHEQLYQSDRFSSLDFSENIRLLVNGLLSSFKNEADIDATFDTSPVELSIHQAIPCSLILNEVMTNILKHAFKGRHNGTIHIHIAESPSNTSVRVTIRDNGVGLPDNFDPSQNDSMGMTLIDLLCDQINADYEFASDGRGTLFRLSFHKTGITGKIRAAGL